jgi:hypothetical protein
MWRIVGLPWPSSRMIIRNVDYNILKSQKLKKQLIKTRNIKLDTKQNKYDPELGVEFPSSRFN